MVKNKNFLVGYKLFFGLLGFSAIVTEIAVLVERAKFVPANFFSYFTIESNVLACAVLLLSAVMVLRKRQGRWYVWLRGATALYMVLVGLGFTLLLSGIENAAFTAVPWDNVVLHYIMPIVLFVDWVLDPPKASLQFRRALVWLLFPLAYVVYSLVRGAAVGWYPYPFLDPGKDGYAPIAVTIGGLMLMAAGLTWLLTRLAGRKPHA